MFHRAALVALLALASAAGANRLTTFAWDPSPDWPAGTTVELCANGYCEAGITAAQHALDVPVEPGGVIQGRARAHADEQSSPWVELSQTLPTSPIGIRATQERIAMAITATSVTASHSATDGTSYNTASVSPTSNRLLLLALNISFMSAHAAGSWPSITPSGLGLTWTEVERHLFYAAGSDFYNSFIVFRAVGTVTPGAINLAFGQTVDTVAWDLIEFTDTDTGGTNGANAIVQSVAANGGTYTSSATLAAFSSADNATFGLVGIAGATAYSPGTGFTELSDHGTEYASQTVIFRNDNSTSVSASHDYSSNSAAIGIEIKAAGGGPAGTALPRRALDGPFYGALRGSVR